jgi:hypothetical protein
MGFATLKGVDLRFFDSVKLHGYEYAQLALVALLDAKS